MSLRALCLTVSQIWRLRGEKYISAPNSNCKVCKRKGAATFAKGEEKCSWVQFTHTSIPWFCIYLFIFWSPFPTICQVIPFVHFLNFDLHCSHCSTWTHIQVLWTTLPIWPATGKLNMDYVADWRYRIHSPNQEAVTSERQNQLQNAASCLQGQWISAY